MQSLPDEHQLILQAQQGSKEAVSRLYQAYAQPIFRYISYRVESDAIAEDLTSDVFLRMVQGLSRYQDTGAPFGAWLFRIAATRVADHYRQKRRTTSSEILDNYPSTDTDPDIKLELQEERALLRRALQGLPDNYQNLIILRFIQQLSHTEVAAILNKSESAVRVMQHRAIKALTKQLEKQEHQAKIEIRATKPPGTP